MQVFLPYPEYIESLATLDKKRLGNQVYREGLTLINGKWPNHPVSKMWRGHEYNLCEYLIAGCKIMAIRQWNKPEVISRWSQFFGQLITTLPKSDTPGWIGDERLHSSHRAALLYKDEEWYSQFDWTEKPQLNYWWPK